MSLAGLQTSALSEIGLFVFGPSVRRRDEEPFRPGGLFGANGHCQRGPQPTDRLAAAANLGIDFSQCYRILSLSRPYSRDCRRPHDSQHSRCWRQSRSNYRRHCSRRDRPLNASRRMPRCTRERRYRGRVLTCSRTPASSWRLSCLHNPIANCRSQCIQLTPLAAPVTCEPGAARR